MENTAPTPGISVIEIHLKTLQRRLEAKDEEIAEIVAGIEEKDEDIFALRHLTDELKFENQRKDAHIATLRKIIESLML